MPSCVKLGINTGTLATVLGEYRNKLTSMQESLS